ncbi:MAG: biopolymer transporter ExbD [Deltaproteobacteria bacterium]|nr:biopolymer transporter ExbD [Deltaproteobacteria bacterium]MCW5804825.1 biopolymer transporter ExbD [Deltaproteobacteria bacterium]
MAIGKLPEAGDDDGEGAGAGEGSLFADINITPLTDVFLVMVVIFMVSALAVQAEQNQQKKQEQKKQEQEQKKESSGLKITLPSGKTAEIDTSKESLVIEVPRSGDVAIGGKQWSDADIDKILLRAYQKDKNTQVILKADTEVAHGRVVNLMERAKVIGLQRLAIGTAGGK